ncbi:MAG TPA: SDR family NAD(P)-dependent oxidoreductase [Thermoleophilaceae bacterium]|jgi:NAD(P)-dependent dehydrogenase (short-subunit alcohol dehydrogenase family)
MTGIGPELTPLRAIVTGASSGIGRAVAEQLAERGAAVALWARRGDELDALAEQLGGGAVAVPCDVSDPAAVARAAAETEERIGRVNALVSAAGIAEPLPLARLDDAAWHRTIGINLSGTFYPAREVALRLREHDEPGSIVTIGSELSSLGLPHYAAYCAAKAGVIGITKALAAELAPRIRVNALCPGPVDTPMLDGELALADDPEAAREQENKRPPLGRLAQPGEIAAAAVWLLCDATFATGALVPVDGGTTMV